MFVVVSQKTTAMAYQPPSPNIALLGSITNLLANATAVNHAFVKGGKAVFVLAGGALYYDSLLDLDSDGSKFAAADPTGQSGTSLTQPDGSPVDADTVPYIVLPGHFYQQFNIRMGDIAAVMFNGLLEFAVFADVGPHNKIGEGSIALHRSLGHEVVINGVFHDDAIDENVVTIVFPGSGNGTPQTPDAIRTQGGVLLQALGGSLANNQ